MGEYRIPAKIKRKILSNNIATIFGGIILCIGIFFLKNFIEADTSTDMFNTEMFSMAFWICFLLSAVFLVIIPLCIILTNYEERKIEKVMKKHGITTKQLDLDYDTIKPVGKIKMGDMCMYYRKMYFYEVVPNQHIAWVYKNEKIKKSKKIIRHRDGSIKREDYTISYKHTYNVVIKTFSGNAVTVVCHTEKQADAIVQHFQIYKHIMFGSGKENEKAYKKMMKEFHINKRKNKK